MKSLKIQKDYLSLIFYLLAFTCLFSIIICLNSRVRRLEIEIEEQREKNVELADLVLAKNEIIAVKDSEIEQLEKDADFDEKEIFNLNSIIDNMNSTVQSLENTILDLEIDNKYLYEVSEYVYNGDWNYDYTESDIKLLAAVMFGECEDSGRWEQMLVGSVVLNRVINPAFPNNIHDVIYQIDSNYEQYAPRTKRIAEAVLSGQPIPSKDADVRYIPEYYYKLAEILLKYGPVAPPFVMYQAHFNQGNVFWEWEGEEFCYK